MKLNSIALLVALFVTREVVAGQSADVLTLDEVANWLRIPVAEASEMAERGVMPGRQVGSSGWRFEKLAMVAWLSNGPLPTRGVEQQVEVSLTATQVPEVSLAGNQTVVTASPPNGDRSAAPTAEETALRTVTPTGKTGMFTIDAGMAYSFGDAGSRGFALFGGRTETDTIALSTNLSYRLDDLTQIYGSTAYSTQTRTTEDVLQGNVHRITSKGLQSLTIGMRRTLMQERLGSPQISGAIDASLPQRSGNQKQVGVELSVLKSMDPVSVYASLRLERNFAVAAVRSSNRVIAGLGYVYALNDTLAVSTSLKAQFADEADDSGLGWRRAKRFDLKLGMPTSFGKDRLFLEPYVSFGLHQSNSMTTIGISLVKSFSP